MKKFIIILAILLLVSSAYSVTRLRGFRNSFYNLTITNSLTIANDLTVTDDVDIDGDIDVDGTSNFDAVDIDGDIDADGKLLMGAFTQASNYSLSTTDNYPFAVFSRWATTGSGGSFGATMRSAWFRTRIDANADIGTSANWGHSIVGSQSTVKAYGHASDTEIYAWHMAGIWAQLETDGNDSVLLKDGCVATAVYANAGLTSSSAGYTTIESGAVACGVAINSNSAANVTATGDYVGLYIYHDNTSCKDFEKGIYIDDSCTGTAIDIGTCTTDIIGQNDETWENATTNGYWTTNGGITTTTDVISGDDVVCASTGKMSFDGATPTTYITESSGDVMDMYVGGVHMMTLVEAAADYIESKVDMKFNKVTVVEDGGNIALIDMSVSATPAQGTSESYSLNLDGNDALTIHGFADTAGGIVDGHIHTDMPIRYGWHQLTDNFVWQAGAYTTVWDVTSFDVDGGTGSNDVVTGAGLGGIIQLKAEDDANDREVTATHGKYFGRDLKAVATIHLRIDATTALAGCEVEFGFSDNPMVDDGEHVCFLFDYSDDADQWQTKSVDGTDASLAAGANPTAGTFQELTLALETNGTAHFIVDDVWYASITGAIDNDGDMYLFWGVKAEGEAFEAIDVGGIWVAWTHQ